MNYYNHKRFFPQDILVCIEEYDKQNKIVIFDFFDSNEYRNFTTFGELNYSLTDPSMVLLTNYSHRRIQENTIYAIKPDVIRAWREQGRFNSNGQNSFLIGYSVDLPNEHPQIFFESVSLDYFQGLFFNSIHGEGALALVPLKIKGKISVTVRNVGQGNWNEINVNNKTKVVFDAGAPMNATKNEVKNIIANRALKYADDKPGLILSHWDKDHYHSLIAMTDKELQNFSFFICRDTLPNLTSRILSQRIIAAIGSKKTFTIEAEQRTTRGGRTLLIPITPTSAQFTLYNAQYHKNRNVSGLVITLKTKSSSIILSGDCHYEQISMSVLPHLNFKHKHHLVVPHHGGKAGKYVYKLPKNVIPDKAIISVGPNKYKHPLSIYTSALTTDRFSVLKTQKVKNDITINL